MANQWDQRYSANEYYYGKEPNNFLKEELSKLNPGKILFIGEGEGRNAVYAAKLEWEVDAVDYSISGKQKAEKLAEESDVKINYLVEDFSRFHPIENKYDVVGIFFIHLDAELRKILFEKVISSLKPAGKIIFECFEKDQIKNTSGGPSDQSLLYSLEDVVTLFIDLDFEKFSKDIVDLSEGKGHSGKASVIRFVGNADK